MRYIILFADKTTKRISGEEAKEVTKQLYEGATGIIIRNAYFDAKYIKAVKPLNKDWFPEKYSEEDKQLPSGEMVKLSDLLPKP